MSDSAKRSIFALPGISMTVKIPPVGKISTARLDSFTGKCRYKILVAVKAISNLNDLLGSSI
jgi:hypothetical protein